MIKQLTDDWKIPLIDRYEYTPDIDGQELIDKLTDLVIQKLRWNGVLSVWDHNPHELVLEALILQAVWSSSLGHGRERISDLIVLCGFDLMPYAKYRRDNPPKGDWSQKGFGTHLTETIDSWYKWTCERIIEASDQELLRD